MLGVRYRIGNTFTIALWGRGIDDGANQGDREAEIDCVISECVIVKEEKPVNDKYYLRHFTEHSANSLRKDGHGAVI